jgi:hypothetical protein
MWEVVLLGLLTGAHAANWGAYKDAPYEGWRPVSYLRSIVVGAVLALLLTLLLGRDALPPLVVLAGILYTLERFGTEWWKSILREDDQKAYTIPMRFGVHGRPVESRLRRYVIGIGVVLAIAVVCAVGSAIQDATRSTSVSVAVLLGGTGGWLTAVGGAWKDAPVEGFSGWKFLRSPVVATAWAIPLSTFTRDWLTLALSAAGFAVASIETYKTFLTRGRPPGKFAGKPVRAAFRRRRRLFALSHAALWGAFAAAAAMTEKQAVAAGSAMSSAASTLMCVVAALAALSVVSTVAGGSAQEPEPAPAPEEPPRGRPGLSDLTR